MANEPTDILSRINRHSGMTVPEGYFDDFARRMDEMLPEHPAAIEERQAPKRGLWLTVRPYVYMAAMFAGIWCMLHMFNFIGNNTPDLNVDNNPVMAAALSDDSFIDDYILQDYDTEDLLDDIYADGIELDELTDSAAEADFEVIN